MWTISGLLGLFLAALAAATVLPMQSEAVLVGLLLSGAYSPWLLLAVAGTGNVLGSVLNWLLGRGLGRIRMDAARLARARTVYGRYGYWSLLLSWVPLIGDPLTVVAGLMREPFWRFLLLVTAAKVGRYLVLMALTLGWMDGAGWSAAR